MFTTFTIRQVPFCMPPISPDPLVIPSYVEDLSTLIAGRTGYEGSKVLPIPRLMTYVASQTEAGIVPCLARRAILSAAR